MTQNLIHDQFFNLNLNKIKIIFVKSPSKFGKVPVVLGEVYNVEYGIYATKHLNSYYNKFTSINDIIA